MMKTGSKVDRVEIYRNETGRQEWVDDLVAVEEPLEIRLNYGPRPNREQKSLAVTMRTPGNDYELATGFLFTEGIIDSYQDILGMRYCEQIKAPEEAENIIIVDLNPDLEADLKTLDRNFYMSSSCGVCGKSSIEAIKVACNQPLSNDFDVPKELLLKLPERLINEQSVFKYTGGLHATGLFDLKGNLKLLREDVGRHNAMDKLIGTLLAADQLPAIEDILLVSGRLSFELVQKAARAGFTFMAAVGAPSSLAVSLAKEFNMTLIGFLKDHKFNIYAGQSRII